MSDGDEVRNFSHPFQPYDIQIEFMNAVYNCLEKGKVGIFESPTGTGKSLSLICGSLTWLRDNQRRTLEAGNPANAGTSEEPSWMLEYTQNQEKQEAIRRKQELNERIARTKAKEKRFRERHESGEPHMKRQKLPTNEEHESHGEDMFLLDDYDSDSEVKSSTKRSAFDDVGLSSETKTMMEKLGYLTHTADSTEGDMPDETKIFFCSRTHSQLTQFSSELRRVKMPPATPANEANKDFAGDIPVENVKHLTLGSRKNLCINSKVNCLGSATAINERCIELQQSTNATTRCPHLPSRDNESLLYDFRDHALAKIRDIEDLGVLGKKLGICPYYASRPAAQHCEIVTLPYPLLLQKSARDALGLSLKNHVVIIDEAHNLMEAIAGIYSVSVTLEQVQQARAQLTEYLQKFRTKLKGKNRVYVAQTIRILDSITTYLYTIDQNRKLVDGVADMVEIMSGKGVDQIDIFKLNKYLHRSKLARKVDGYTAFLDPRANVKTTQTVQKSSGPTPRQSVPVLIHVQSFLLSLMNPSAEGRFFYSREDSQSVTLRYMLLDPTFHFRDIVEDARAVVLAGGTMSPISDYKNHLLSYLHPSRITTLSCGHVIPTTNLLAFPISQSSQGSDFDFTFENRNKSQAILDLGLTILNLAGHIPDGLVVFFPSYSYLDTCVTAWKQSIKLETKSTLWERITRAKKIFLEQRSQQQTANSASTPRDAVVDSVLKEYSAAVAFGNGRGAVLFAVVGGTLSEGINFSDALGRGVVVVGLPFPNPHTAEWKAKMQYISLKERQAGGNGEIAAKDFIENACMRAVNQCIGRAIRHQADYAAILMLDRRYKTKRIQDKLPGWIRGSLIDANHMKDVEQRLDSFFYSKR